MSLFHDHTYYKPEMNYLRIDPKYADDITYLSTRAERNNKIEKEVPFQVICTALLYLFAPTFAPTIAIKAPPIPKIIGIKSNSNLMAIPNPAAHLGPNMAPEEVISPLSSLYAP